MWRSGHVSAFDIININCYCFTRDDDAVGSTTMWKKRTNVWTAARHTCQNHFHFHIPMLRVATFLFSPVLWHTWQQRPNSKSVCSLLSLSLIGRIDKRAKKYFLTLISAIKTWLRRKTSSCWNEQLPPRRRHQHRKHLQSFTHRQMRLLLCEEKDMKCEKSMKSQRFS